MNCREFEERLQQRLDGELASESADSNRHLSECATCRALHAAAGRLEQGLRRRLLERPLSPDGLTGRIVSQVLAEQRVTRRQRRIAVVAALAAGLLLVIIERNWPRSPEPGTTVPEVVKIDESPAVPPFKESVGEAGSALAALLSRTADETVNQGRLLLPDRVPAPMMAAVDDWQPTFEPPALPLREAGQGVSSGLEPLASSARRAFNLFLREMPPMPAEAKQ